MTPSSQRVSTLLGLAIAALITIAVPDVYIASALIGSRAELRTAAEITARLVTDFVATSPGAWQSRQDRLEHLMKNDPMFMQPRGLWQVLTLRGEVLATVGETPLSPVGTASAPVYDAGVLVGQVSVSASLRRIATIGAALTLLGLALGLSVYAMVRRLE